MVQAPVAVLHLIEQGSAPEAVSRLQGAQLAQARRRRLRRVPGHYAL
jgi:hypothetical protein